MKKLIFLSMIVCSFGIKAQQIDHPTILNVEVNYTEDPAGGFIVDSVKKVRPNAHVTLKNMESISGIHLKIKNETGEQVLYEVTYTMGSTPVVNDSGITLYQKDEEGVLHISSPFLVPLTAYQYEISTEDSNALESDIYSTIQ